MDYTLKIDGKLVNFQLEAKRQKTEGKWKGWRLDAVAAELRRNAQRQKAEQENPIGDCLWA